MSLTTPLKKRIPQSSTHTASFATAIAWVLLLSLNPWASAQNELYDWSRGKRLSAGIQFARVEVNSPRKVVLYGLRVDTQTEGLTFHTTGRRSEWVEGKTETNRQTSRNFLRTARANGIPMIVAINADAFSPWPAPYDQETPTDLSGLAISQGIIVSRGSGSPSLLRTKSGQFRIGVTNHQTDTSDIDLAVSGFALCLADGKPLLGGKDLHPRTGLGLSEDHRYVVMVIIDGRQPASAGATTEELGAWLKHFGAHRGINMDGGGSTTIAWWNPNAEDKDKCQLLNRPVGNGSTAKGLTESNFRPSERANGNNLGISIRE
ncbi:MAG: phosphodiester glycosidase family protein [Verrucomicrobia bacterium]|nr:phosphodiester glycosidase family protein [Verrucomicrobiota bacterium]